MASNVVIYCMPSDEYGARRLPQGYVLVRLYNTYVQYWLSRELQRKVRTSDHAISYQHSASPVVHQFEALNPSILYF